MTTTSPDTAAIANHVSMRSGQRVSILVPTFNRANYIEECLDSLLAQTVPALEVIVIDDGSEDGTQEVLERYGTRIRTVRKNNGGKPTAVNLGLTLAKGDLIWIFDDDDVALPDAIETRLAALQGQPDAGFVYSPHYYGRDGPNGKILRGRLHNLPAHDPTGFKFALMRGCFFHLATALVRADAYRRVGPFDTQLLSSEDYDMQLRLALAFPAICSPQPCFIFRQHAGLRGAKSIRYGGSQRARVFQQFDQQVGRKLLAQLTLDDYLPSGQAQPPTALSRRQALLARAVVMASKGCVVEAADDWLRFAALLPDPLTPSPRELQGVVEAVCTGYFGVALDDQWGDLRVRLRDLRATTAGRRVTRSLAKGLFILAKGYPGPLWSRLTHLRRAGLLLMASAIPTRTPHP